MSAVKRKTARERDQELIAKAGPWVLSGRQPFTSNVLNFSFPEMTEYGDTFSWRDVMEAVTRELNRIAKKKQHD